MECFGGSDSGSRLLPCAAALLPLMVPVDDPYDGCALDVGGVSKRKHVSRARARRPRAAVLELRSAGRRAPNAPVSYRYRIADHVGLSQRAVCYGGAAGGPRLCRARGEWLWVLGRRQGVVEVAESGVGGSLAGRV